MLPKPKSMGRWFDQRAVRILVIMVAVSIGIVIGKTYIHDGYFNPDLVPVKQPSERHFVSEPATKTAATIGKINILNANNVAALKKENRCVPLKTANKKLICYDTKDKYIGPMIANTGAWEMHVWNPMLKILNEDPELGLIDIGSNIGVFTVSAAALGRRVVAVEAFYENIQRMSESLRLGKLSDKVTIVYNAVSNVYEDVFFWRPVDNPGGTHTLSKGVTLAPNKPVFQGDHSKVNTIFMDDLPHVIPFSKAVLKIDIEGYENKAFKKAEILLDSLYIRALFMEWTFVKSSDDCLYIVKIMMARGYRPHNLFFQPLKGTTRPEMKGWPGDIVWLKPKTKKPPVNAGNARDVVRSPVQIAVSNGYSINIKFPATVPSVAQDVRCIPLKTANDNSICIDTKDKFIGRTIETSGSWEQNLWEKMKKFLIDNPEAGLIDIGANIGVFTLSAAAMGRKVIAVEAFYENVQRLCESIRLGNFSNKVTVVHNAVSDVYETVNFWRPADNPGGTHTLSKGVTLGPNKPTFVGAHSSVTTIHLDDLVHIRKLKQAVMKIDIEGYETKAFKSAEQLLDNIDIKALFMEWTFITKDRSCLSIVQMMTKRKYQAHDMELKPLSGSKFEEVKKWPNSIVWVKR